MREKLRGKRGEGWKGVETGHALSLSSRVMVTDPLEVKWKALWIRFVYVSLTPVFIKEGPFLKFVCPFHNYLSIVFGTLTLVVVSVLAGVLFNKKK